jgi:glucokinase
MLKNLEGIIYCLQLETSKDYETCKEEVKSYIHQQQKQHPQRDTITLARHYLADKLYHNNHKKNSM